MIYCKTPGCPEQGRNTSEDKCPCCGGDNVAQIATLQTEALTGAVRSVLYPIGQGGFPIRLDLVLLNDVAMRRLGATYGEGQGKYGTFNWQKGFPESVYIQHAMEHLLSYMSGESKEDDLAHAVWNLMSLMWVQEKKPELLDIQNAREKA